MQPTLQDLARLCIARDPDAVRELRERFVATEVYLEHRAESVRRARAIWRHRGGDPARLPHVTYHQGFDLALQLAAPDPMLEVAVRTALEALQRDEPLAATAILEALVGRWEHPTPRA